MDATHTQDRLISAREAARRLGRSPSWFSRHRRRLERGGFPRPVAIVERYCPRAIDRWINEQVYGTVGADDEDPFLNRIDGG